MAIAALVVELAGVSYYYRRDGTLLYAAPTLPARESTVVDLPGPASLYVLHPVLGFIQRPSVRPRDLLSPGRLRAAEASGDARWLLMEANNFGFFSPDDYPRAARDDHFSIGVFGGSLAQWLVLEEGERIATGVYETGLTRGRRVEVIPFAQGGFKQPQQLMTLEYFLARGQRLDLVINIDGFNEVSLSQGNRDLGVDAAFPSAQHLVPLAALHKGGASEQFLAAALDAQRSRREMREWMERLGRARSGLLRLYFELSLAGSARRHRHASARVLEASASEAAQGGSVVWLDRAPPTEMGGPASPEVLEPARDLWRRSSQLMAESLRQLDIPYLHVLQPNQYYGSESMRRINSEWIGIDRFAGVVPRGYALLEGSLEQLRARGVNAVSAADLFERVPEPTYVDRCCHLNRLGNQLLGGFVIEEIERTLGSSPGTPGATE